LLLLKASSVLCGCGVSLLEAAEGIIVSEQQFGQVGWLEVLFDLGVAGCCLLEFEVEVVHLSEAVVSVACDGDAAISEDVLVSLRVAVVVEAVGDVCHQVVQLDVEDVIGAADVSEVVVVLVSHVAVVLVGQLVDLEHLQLQAVGHLCELSLQWHVHNCGRKDQLTDHLELFEILLCEDLAWYI